jgi:DNA-binding GntR family transcriptional regulator
VPVVHDSGQTPLWQQVAGDLRRKITAGELSGQITGEMRLASDYGVSRDTVRVALLRLEREGLVRVRGRARRVVPPDEREVVRLSGHEAAGGHRGRPGGKAAG